MALQKTFTLPSGAVGTHIRLRSLRWCKEAHEASGLLGLFADAEKKVPLVEIFAKVRISGAVFDSYRAASLVGSNQEQQLYLAAKAGHLICDQGSDALQDALDV